MDYIIMENTKIPNTTMYEGYLNGAHRNYLIVPNDGYVLHDNVGEFEEDGQIIYQFATGECTCGRLYDFDNTTTILGYTAYGEREFFAMPVDEVPEGAVVYGGVIPPQPEPEIM